jgi:hypothetical protein
MFLVANRRPSIFLVLNSWSAIVSLVVGKTPKAPKAVILAGGRTSGLASHSALPPSVRVVVYRMDDDYYSIDSILSENQVSCLFSIFYMYIYPRFAQKIQCTFKVDIPDMGHLDGGREPDVRPS